MKIRFKNYVIDIDKVIFAYIDSSTTPVGYNKFYKVYIRFDEMDNGIFINCESENEAEDLLEKILGD